MSAGPCSSLQTTRLVLQYSGCSFRKPPTLQSSGGTVQLAELLAIQTGLKLLHLLNLRGTVYSDCLGAVKKITRRWSSGRSFLEAGAALVSSSRAYLSDQIQLKWIKGHPERSTTPPSAWSKQKWGIYLTDALSKNCVIASLPFSPVPSIQIHSVPLHEILISTPLPDSWQWVGPEGLPPLGSLRAMLNLQRVVAYRSNRDSLRAARGASPSGRIPINRWELLPGSPVPVPYGSASKPSAPFGTYAGTGKTRRWRCTRWTRR